MDQKDRKYILIALAAVLVVVIALAGPILFSRDTASAAPAAAGCSSSQGCSMMGGGSGTGGCGMSGGHMGMMGGMNHGCTVLTGTVVAVGADGSVTLKVRPTTDIEKNALKGVKAGDSLPLAIVAGAAQSTAKTGTSVQVAKYVCPMHPEVTSEKPGRCPKCGMDLVQAKK